MNSYFSFPLVRGAWSRRHPRLAAVVGLLCLAAGVLLIWRPWRDAVPDPSTAPLAQAAAFLGDDRFAALPSTDREAYIAALSRRYLFASTSDRRQIDYKLTPGSDVMRPLQRQLGLAMVRESLDGYDQLSAAERADRLAALRAFVVAMGFRSGAAAPLSPGTPDPVATAADDQNSFRQGLNRFKRDLVDGGLNARDRAALAAMAADVRRISNQGVGPRR